VTLTHLLAILAIGFARSSTLDKEANTCSGCVCTPSVDNQDTREYERLLLESSVPERRVSGAGPWWEEEYEKMHLEAWIMIALVLVTVVFDLLWHKLKHEAHALGSISLQAHMDKHHHHHAKHVHAHSLNQELHHRLSSELSVLGFLALSVWTCNQAGLFEHLEEQDYGIEGLKLPEFEEEYLHMVEDIHIHLFVTMCFYFLIIYFIICMANVGFRKAQNSNTEIKEAYQEQLITPENGAAYFAKKGPFRSAFYLFREYYFLSLQAWLGQWDFLDQHINYIVEDIKKDASYYGVHVDMNDAPDEKGVRIPSLMRTWFPFHLYFTVRYRNLMDELIEVKWTTWLSIVFFLLVKALIIRSSKTGIDLTIGWAVVCQVLILVMILVNLYFWSQAKATVKRGTFATPVFKNSWVHKVHPVTLVARALQVALFFTLYALTGGIIQEVEWRRNPGWNILDCLILFFGGIAEACVIGIVLPIYSILISTGPFMQNDHVIHMTTIVHLMAQGISKGKGPSVKTLVHMAHDTEHFHEEANKFEEEIQAHYSLSGQQVDDHANGSPPEEDNKEARI